MGASAWASVRARAGGGGALVWLRYRPSPSLAGRPTAFPPSTTPPPPLLLMVLLKPLSLLLPGDAAAAEAGASDAVKEMELWSLRSLSMTRTTPGTPTECLAQKELGLKRAGDRR
jgi:hypothetical protein